MTIILELTSEQEERLRQLAMLADKSSEAFAGSVIARMLFSPSQPAKSSPSSCSRNLLSYRGVGSDASTGKDAQEHVDELRS